MCLASKASASAANVVPTDFFAASLTSAAFSRPCRPRLADFTVFVSVRMSVEATLAAVPYSPRTARAVAECLSENSPASSGKILSATDVSRFLSAVRSLTRWWR